jgi:DNA-binding CsgD family transcriptional regulator
VEYQQLINLNRLICGAYECSSFSEFLKLAILQLHELVPYDSGMFFCGISRDCSFFKPYTGGSVERYYQKQQFSEREQYLKKREEEGAGREALVFKALDYRQGAVAVESEPRSSFLASQEKYHIACVRIMYKGQFLGEVYLHRSLEKLDFNEADMLVLRLLQPHISNVFHMIHTVAAAGFLETDGGRMAKKGLCLLDETLSLTGGNVTGLEMLKTPTAFGSSVLFHVKELCEDLLSDTKGGAPLLLRSGSFKTPNGNLLADIVYQKGGASIKVDRFFVTMEYEDREQVLSDYKFKFTKREADIIDGVIQGKNNAQLAGALGLSENTIKTHIRSIYRKVGASNRTELAYILMTNA